MSVGMQRLREETELIRQGAIDKGEDPAVVDVALALDERRRALLSEGDGLKAERNAASKQVGEAIRGGASPDGPEVAALREPPPRQRESASPGSMPTSPPWRPSSTMRSCGSPTRPPGVPVGGEEAIVTVREWGEQLPRTQPLIGEVGADAPAGGATWERRPHWELGADLGLFDLERARRSPARASRSTRASARGSSARSSTGSSTSTSRERLHRGLAAGRGEHGVGPGDRPDPGQGRPDVRRHPGRPVPGADPGGAGHEHPSG